MSKVSFYLEWGGSADLDVDDIWPDGDAPENPTVDDVIDQMRNTASTARWICREWNLEIEDIEVTGPGGHRNLGAGT